MTLFIVAFVYILSGPVLSIHKLLARNKAAAKKKISWTLYDNNEGIYLHLQTTKPLRITGGTALNRKLKTPGQRKREVIRPTSDRVREALFNMLGDRVSGARILDLFSGTGSLGIEALSRGAAYAVFVDQHALSLDLIRTNLHTCFKHADVEIIRLGLAQGVCILFTSQEIIRAKHV